MTPDSVELLFGSLWLGSIFGTWLVYFGGMQMIQLWEELPPNKIIIISILFMIGFAVVMGWAQFQRRIYQYQAVTDFVLQNENIVSK